jgi:hypothetical protein
VADLKVSRLRGKGRALAALLALTTTQKVHCQDCLVPETYAPYFQAALDNVESTLSSHVVGGLDDIGFGPIAQLSIKDLVNFEDDIFQPLFGDQTERNDWINVTADVDILSYLESKLEDVIGSTPPDLNVACDFEATDDLEEGDLPYRYALEFVLSGHLLETDLDVTSLSPEIAVLPEELFDPLSLTMEGLSADYELRLPMTLDTKRRKFMIGEIAIMLNVTMNSHVSQNIPLTETVSPVFEGSLDVDARLSYSSVSDWAYTASFETSLTAETSAVANLGLIASDDDLFDDKPREYLHIIT